MVAEESHSDQEASSARVREGPAPVPPGQHRHSLTRWTSCMRTQQPLDHHMVTVTVRKVDSSSHLRKHPPRAFLGCPPGAAPMGGETPTCQWLLAGNWRCPSVALEKGGPGSQGLDGTAKVLVAVRRMDTTLGIWEICCLQAVGSPLLSVNWDYSHACRPGAKRPGAQSRV